MAKKLPIDVASNYKIEFDNKLGKSKWRGYPDSDYSWDGDRLRKETSFIDEDGKPQVDVSYRDPIEIIADFKPETKVFGVEDKIERIASKKFGGSLKGFIWLDNVSGGGEVVLPFTAPHIFIATGDRLNPTLAEIETDTNKDNYYEIEEGKTRVFVKSFSGIGGAAGAPPTLIAHWKMNENTVGDNDELVTDGDFPNGNNWSLGGTWSVAGGVVSCDGGQPENQFISQDLPTIVIGRKYRFSYEVTANTLVGTTSMTMSSTSCWGVFVCSGTVGVHSYYKVVTSTVATDIRLAVLPASTSGSLSIDNISVKLCAVEDSSGNDHDGLLQEDTSAAHVAGKVNGAFDFGGSTDYIEIADSDDFTFALTPFSASVWMLMHEGTDFPIISKGVEGTNGEWRLYTDGSDKLFARFYDENIDKYIGRSCDASALAEDEWLHIVMTSDGTALSGGINLYVDGVNVDDTDDESATFVAMENLTGPVWIGYDGTNYADGLFDNVMIFSTELSQDDVTRLYNDGHGTEILSELEVGDRGRIRERSR